jgi:hypothetical protein
MPFTKSKYFIVLSTAILLHSCSSTQNPDSVKFVSIGRGAPVLDPLSLLETRPAEQTTPFGTLPNVNEILNGDIIVGPLLLEAGDMFGMAPERIEIYSAANGDSPEGIEPLETDLFNSTDFYKDMEHWTDPRYFRCNSSFGIEQQRVATPLSTATIGDNPSLRQHGAIVIAICQKKPLSVPMTLSLLKHTIMPYWQRPRLAVDLRNMITPVFPVNGLGAMLVYSSRH